MKLNDFKKSLPPVVKVKSLKADLLSNQEIIQSIASMKLAGGSIPQIDNANSGIHNFMGTFKSKYKNVITNINFIAKQLNSLPNKLGSSVATSKELTLIATAEFANIYASYLPKYIIEASKLNSKNKSGVYSPNKRYMRELREDARLFKVANEYLTMDASRFTKLINEVPHLKVTDTNERSLLPSRVLKHGINPITAISSGFTGNPIYHARLYILQFEMWRYEQQRDEVQQLELLLLSLKQQAEGGSSPGIEKEIEAIEDRIKVTNRKIQNFAGVDEEDENEF